MKTNVIVFLGNSYELCKAFGLFGKAHRNIKKDQLVNSRLDI